MTGVRIDSTLNAQEGRAALSDVQSGKLELVYVTPEHLQRGEFMAVLQRVGVPLIVSDEAHCVSQWAP